MAPRTCLALLLGALIVSPVAADAGLPAWGQFHYNAAHTGFNPNERVLTRANVKRLRKAWAVETGAAIEGSPAVSGDLVFVGSDDNTLRAYHQDGGLAWSRPLQGASLFLSAPALAGKVFAFSSSSIVTALDPSSGQPSWSKQISSVHGAFPGSPTAAGGLLYAVPYQLVALDASSGSVRWTRPNVGCFICSPAVAKGVLYVGAGPAAGRRLLALRAATGAPRWSFRPQGGTSFAWSASPAVSGGRVFQAAYVERNGTKAYSIYAFKASSGKRLWKVAAGSSDFLTSSSPAVAYGTVFYVSPGGRAYAFRASNGKRLWSKAIAPSASSPAVAGGVVYFGAGVTVYAVDARSGKTLWRAQTSSDPSDAAVFGSTLYIGSGDGTLYAYRLSGG